jgi:hypothetical protein
MIDKTYKDGNLEHISIPLEEEYKKIIDNMDEDKKALKKEGRWHPPGFKYHETFKQRMNRLEENNPRIKKLPKVDDVNDCDLPF